MSALFFPNLNALRLVLSSGLVPKELTHAPAAAGFDPLGRLWLELPELPSREIIVTLARIGVQALGGTGVPMEPVRCWAELLHLRKSVEPLPGTILFVGPDREAARFAARLRRTTASSIRVSLRDDPINRSALIVCRNPPARILSDADESGSTFVAFAEQSPGVWVQVGWEHPLPNHLVIPPNSSLLIRPLRAVSAAPWPIPVPENEEYRLPFVNKPVAGIVAHPNVVPVTLHLVPRRSPSDRESLWVLDDAEATEFWNICASVDERLLRRLEVTSRICGSATRVIVRSSDGRGNPPFLPLTTTGYSPDPRLPGLFIPANRVLRPHLRIRELAAVLGLSSDRIVWVEPQPDGSSIPHAIPVVDFRSLSELIEYRASPVVRLNVEPHHDLFPLGRLVLLNETIQTPETEAPIPIEEAEEESVHADSTPSEPGWFLRSLKKLMARLNLDRESEATHSQAADPPPATASPAERRVEQTLASPEALRHGPDWAAKRRELEAMLFQELPRLGTEGRATRWAALANVYTKLGNPNDAAVCWMTAAWESSTPPLAWLKQWLAAECQAAKLTESQCVLERWLSERQPGIGRVVAAYAAVAGHTQPPTEFLAMLPRILGFLDQHFEDLPVRAAWLARLAVTRVCDGDALGLARCRDRVLTRLADRGPGLDLDEPSFLRFHGSMSAERFQAARKWLESTHEKVHDWIKRHSKSAGRLLSDRHLQSDRRLQWAGLVPEKEATSAYADFMLAWGLGCLGERIQANNLAARARKRLLGTTLPGVDPAAHAVLGDLFLYRVKDAQEGRTPKPGLPPGLQSRIDALPDLARYAVDRLREYSQILEPRDRINAYRGDDLKVFWGNDRLGERLGLLVNRTEPDQLADEAAALLHLCATTPTTDTVPRVILTLLEVAPRLDQSIQLRILDQLPTAIDWLEPWIATGRWLYSERLDRVNRYRTRMIKAGFTTAASLDPALVGSVIGQLIRQLLQLGNPIRESLLNVAAQVFRALRRLGLKSEAESLVLFLDPDRERDDTKSVSSLIARLGLSIGWFTAGNEDTGYRTLNEAKELLYLTLTGESHIEERTRLALAYAEALGFAPPGIAHGRLEEIFERLEKVKETGSTNRWFTLKPLQLIDVVVRSVVTDEFALGPAVRGWLDDDEFLIRGRIHRDLAAVLREQGIG
jgi:hypothetical protein